MTRQDRIETAARLTLGRARTSAIGGVMAAELDDLDAALALPADPVSVDERERALVRAGIQHGVSLEPGNRVGPFGVVDAVLAAVNATHPRAPSVEYERGREDAARVCEAAAGTDHVVENFQCTEGEFILSGPYRQSVVRPVLATLAARIRALAPGAQAAPSALPKRDDLDVDPDDFLGPPDQCGSVEPGNLLAPICVLAPGHVGPHREMSIGTKIIAPSAPRDQGGGLRVWFSLVLRNAAERGLIVSQDETGIDAALAEVGPPPTDGVASACRFLDGATCAINIRNDEPGRKHWRGMIDDGRESESRREQDMGACIIATARALGWTPETPAALEHARVPIRD